MRQASKAIRKHILALLSDGQFHSGETIAQQVGLSRTAVAGHISQLSDWGLDVFKVKGKGEVAVRADALVSLNGRPAARLIDPSVDLTRLRNSQSYILDGPKGDALDPWAKKR